MKLMVAAVLALCTLASASAQRPAGPGRYNIEQACSDRAQLNTIAFDALGFLSGDLCSSTFLPPGKVCDYFGFQYLRDIDTGTGGHNTDFLTNIANNVWVILNDSQKAGMTALAREQAVPLQDLARRRFPLLKAFHRLLGGDLPPGSKELDRDAVRLFSADFFEFDGGLAFRRAQVFGEVARSLDAAQLAAISKLVFGQSHTWPQMPEQIDKRGLSHAEHVALMTYASEFFSWYAGSVEADTYFCPERHGTYFGSFYMKDAPAMGRRGYSISTALTGDKGEAFLRLLTPQQRTLVTDLVDLQRADLAEIVTTRRAISVGLRQFMKATSADRAGVIALARRYGELDGDMSWLYATHFAQVARTLSASQKQELRTLRDLDAFPCRNAYLYSEPIPAPEIPNTDVFFKAQGTR